MEYQLIDYRWAYLPYQVDKVEKEYIMNMNEFEAIVNKAIAEGWRPLGPPSFVGHIKHSDHTRNMIQAMTRVSEDIPQKTEVRRASSRIAKAKK